MNCIYLDNSATTPLDPEVFEAMKPYFTDHFGNAGSLHSFGLEAKKAVDESRKSIAAFLGCDPTEIIFTSGGSESDNLAIRGILSAVGGRRSAVENSTANDPRQTIHDNPHIITSAFEHKAVLDTVRSLEKEGVIEATYVKPGADGVIRVEDIKNAIKDDTVLVSVMYVNNEVGTIQPIREIGKMIKKINAGRESSVVSRESLDKRHTANDQRIFFHTDAVQAAEYCPMNVNDLGVDLLTMTAHKIHGPKGIGLLFIRRDTPISPEISGGGQERGFRAGTENVAGIVGMAETLDRIKNHELRIREIQRLRDKLIDGILTNIPNSILNGQRDKLAPHIANISFINAEGESILLNLDFLGIAVSTGSACTSRSLEPSHVLTTMGIPPEKAHGSIRFSLGRHTTKAEIDQVLEILPRIIDKLRQMSPFK